VPEPDSSGLNTHPGATGPRRSRGGVIGVGSVARRQIIAMPPLGRIGQPSDIGAYRCSWLRRGPVGLTGGSPFGLRRPGARGFSPSVVICESYHTEPQCWPRVAPSLSSYSRRSCPVCTIGDPTAPVRPEAMLNCSEVAAVWRPGRPWPAAPCRPASEPSRAVRFHWPSKSWHLTAHPSPPNSRSSPPLPDVPDQDHRDRHPWRSSVCTSTSGKLMVPNGTHIDRLATFIARTQTREQFPVRKT